MHIERRRRQTDLIGDLADRRAFIAMLDEDALRRRQNLGAPNMALALGLAGRAWRGGRVAGQSRTP